ncbi:amidase [Panacagrimonas perspica]|nr:amidase [Panacagrimonas perspica]THD02406.1 amidase [Panacagrimonas perspica]
MKKPTASEILAIAASLKIQVTPEQLEQYLAVMEGSTAGYQLLESLGDELPLVRYPRTPGYQPPAAENPHNAWYYRTTIHGAAQGRLKGKTFAVKDNVCVAGVPMMNGASTLQGYVPDVDATVVTRILDAGGTILGKSHCEYLCFSGGSHTSALGPVINARKAGHMSGGSSSGSATLVASGVVDMAIGGDQGGSIRIPSAFSGTVGMKGTHGLVPYTGAMPIEATIDHLGPITSNVADSALLLEVLAGGDDLDPRQGGVRTQAYTAALGQGVKGLRIGVLREGFGHALSEEDVDAAVRAAASLYQGIGAEVEEISIPLHLAAPAIWSAIAHEGGTVQMLHGNGFGFNWKGLYVPSLMQAHDAWRTRADDFSDSVKATLLFGQYVLDKYRGQHYARAQNLSRRLQRVYDEALSRVDVLLMPTVPMKARRIPAPDAGIAEVCARAFESIPNTAPFNVTGHPAISIPCAVRDDLPIGLMLVGKHWEECTLYRAAHAFEQAVDWQRA